jgi:hypothetical protein
MSAPRTIQLKEFCKLFEFDDRQVRFILERGFVPKGVEEKPSTGNRREFGPRHAFFLAIALHLRSAGMRTSAAAAIAETAVEGLPYFAKGLKWTFLPAHGWFDTDDEYSLEIIDGRVIGLQTSAYSGEPCERVGWLTGGTRRKKNPEPVGLVTLRLDLKKIADVLSTVEGWSCPHRKAALARANAAPD